jgi:hypothetical protein
LYTIVQKIAIIDLARSIGIRATARNNDIHRNMIQRWIKVEEKFCLLAMRRGVNPYKRTRLDGNGRSSTIPFDTEENLWTGSIHNVVKRQVQQKVPSK